MNRETLIVIDPLAHCNLRCPACANGNTKTLFSNKLLDPKLLKAVLQKATQERSPTAINLFNWSEPFLHPQLPELVEIIDSFGLKSCISSNLNRMRNVEELLQAGLTNIRISTSGFTQDVYGQTHVRGDIETVKRNMVSLREAIRRLRKDVYVEIAFLRYQGNEREEKLMRAFGDKLGFHFLSGWALMCPLEKYVGSILQDPSLPSYSQNDREFMAKRICADPFQAYELLQPTRTTACRQKDYLVLDSTGHVQLCCGVYDSNRFSLGNYLDKPFDAFQADKSSHPFCKKCVEACGNLYVETCSGHAAVDELCLQNISANRPTAEPANA